MWLYRRLLRVKRTDKRTNESVLNELSTSRQMPNFLNKRRHTTDLMFTAFMGQVEGKETQECHQHPSSATSQIGLD